MEASNVFPSSMTSKLSENKPEKVAGESPKRDLLENLPKGNSVRLEKLFESLNLQGIESWKEQQ